VYADMIVKLSEKYNIASNYTSFITVYEREKKIFSIPFYQETRLNSPNGLNCSIMEDFDCCDCFGDYLEDKDICYHPLKMSIPRKIAGNETALLEKIQSCCEKFCKEGQKSLYTYFLFAIYDIFEDDFSFDFDEFLDYIELFKDEILSNEIYQKLIYVCYKVNTGSYYEKRLRKLLDKDYQKLIDCGINIKFSIDRPLISAQNFDRIIKENKIDENINDILAYLLNEIRKKQKNNAYAVNV